MLSYDQIKAKLIPMNLKEVERQTGLSYTTIFNLTKSESPNGFSYGVILRLSKYLESL